MKHFYIFLIALTISGWIYVPATDLFPLPTYLPLVLNNPINCDPSYPDICIPPPPPQLDCSDIPYKDFKVLPPDPHNLDSDGNGIGCETPNCDSAYPE